MNEQTESFYSNNEDEQEKPSVISLPPSLKRGYESPATTSDESGSGYVFESYKADPLWTKIKARGKQNQSRMNSYSLRLCQAVSLNDTETVDLLLKKGVPANCSDHHKRTPLHLAACKGYVQIVQKLLNHGADPNARDSIGNTALHLAACTHNINVVLLLLKAGTDARSRDTLGRSPLQLAESKLKILQQSNFPDREIKAQVSLVIEMLMHFSSKEDSLDPELLANFKSQVQLSDTREKVDSQLRNLLDSIGSLSIKS